MKFTIFFAALFLFLNSSAQKTDHEKIEWEKEPAVHELSPDEEQELSVILKDRRVREYKYDNNDELVQYSTVHKIIYVNSDAAVEQNNKIYIPTSNYQEVIDPRARVVLKNGKVKVLNKDNIRTAEEDGVSYQFFAVEGAEIGCEIEYIFTTKSAPSINGVREIFQSNVLRKNISYDIYLPSNLFLATKSYNGLPEMEYDTTETDRNRYFLEVDKIEPLKSEKYSAYESNLKSVIFKLDKNSATRATDITRYSNVANSFYQRIHGDVSKSTKKEIAKLANGLKLNKLEEEEKIRKIEYFLKNNYHVVEDQAYELTEVDKILKNKICNSSGIVKLFALFFEETGIEHELGFTSDRTELSFDPEFESYNFLQEYFFYFPQHDTYLAPSEYMYRYGYLPANWTNNNGLFIKKVSLGDVVTGVGKIGKIQPLSWELSGDNMEVEVSFPADFSTSNLIMKREFSGYNGAFLQPAYEMMEPKDQKEVTETIFKWVNDNMEIQEVKVLNTDEDAIFRKPMVFEGKASTTALIEKAGDKYIFKVGEVIGGQQEMYDENERKLDVEIGYNHYFHRKIKVNIPEGYHITNPEALSINVSDGEDGTMAFISAYTIKDNVMEIDVEEYYKQIYYPITRYKTFRDVVNAAADFNKVVLFLEKD